MILRESELGPYLRKLPYRTALVTDVFFVCPTVVEEIELQQLDALIFEVEKRAVDAASIRAEEAQMTGDSGNETFRSTGCPVFLPVDPRSFSPCNRVIAARQRAVSACTLARNR